MIDVKQITHQTPFYDSTVKFLEKRMMAWMLGVDTGMCIEFLSTAYLLNAVANGGTVEQVTVPFEQWKRLYCDVVPEEVFFNSLIQLKELKIIDFETFLRKDNDELTRFLTFTIPSLHPLDKKVTAKTTPYDSYWLLRASITDEKIDQLKSMRYVDFLNTDYWATVRKYVLYERGEKCFLCPSTKNLHVHHKTYEHRGCEIHHLDDLVILCNNCHARHHDKLA